MKSTMKKHNKSGNLAPAALLFLLFGCVAQSPPPAKPHHTADGFKNVYEYDHNSLADLLRWRWDALWKDIPGPETYKFELAANDPAFLRKNRTNTTLTWIGHATVLLQMRGKNILTDPVFARRASPVQWAGPERVVAPGIAMDDLPPIDMVLISHDHYDALCEPSVEALYNRPGGRDTNFIVPMGMAKWFHERGIANVVELDWWEKRDLDGFAVTATPVQHWSKRSLFSKNETLWAGWVVESSGFRFFFSGDSGYCPHFKEIGEKFGGFDLAAIPIGAYEPRWFMAKHHMAPEESVLTHMDVRSKKSVGIHWGTFVLTDEPLDEPPRRLSKAMHEKGLEEDAFVVMKHGETIFPED